ncbi:MAG TPA: HD domain-containing protein [Solirubrobacterales bacterium]|jgi:(p)ppGpp synthase/HD superfamily hydrolase
MLPEHLRIDAAAGRSKPVREALEVAREAHAGQIRSGSGGMPYIDHPVAVSELLSEHGYDGTVLTAALLHDVVEKSELSVDDVAKRFGESVAELVETLTDDEEVEPYERRKEEHRGRVAKAGGNALAIYGVDKLSNIRALRRAYASEGERAGEEFKAPLNVKERIWASDLEMLRREAPELPFLDDFEAELAKLHELRANRVPASPS